MSPVNDSYGKPGLLPAEHRVRMCQLAVEGSPYAMVDTWEASQPVYQRSLWVLQHIQSTLNSQINAAATAAGGGGGGSGAHLDPPPGGSASAPPEVKEDPLGEEAIRGLSKGAGGQRVEERYNSYDADAVIGNRSVAAAAVPAQMLAQGNLGPGPASPEGEGVAEHGEKGYGKEARNHSSEADRQYNAYDADTVIGNRSSAGAGPARPALGGAQQREEGSGKGSAQGLGAAPQEEDRDNAYDADMVIGNSSSSGTVRGRRGVAGADAGGVSAGGSGEVLGRVQEVRTVLLCGSDVLASMLAPGVWTPDLLERLLAEHGVVCITRFVFPLPASCYTQVIGRNRCAGPTLGME